MRKSGKYIECQIIVSSRISNEHEIGEMVDPVDKATVDEYFAYLDDDVKLQTIGVVYTDAFICIEKIAYFSKRTANCILLTMQNNDCLNVRGTMKDIVDIISA